jgi:hypothetical protein
MLRRIYVMTWVTIYFSDTIQYDLLFFFADGAKVTENEKKENISRLRRAVKMVCFGWPWRCFGMDLIITCNCFCCVCVSGHTHTGWIVRAGVDELNCTVHGCQFRNRNCCENLRTNNDCGGGGQDCWWVGE